MDPKGSSLSDIFNNHVIVAQDPNVAQFDFFESILPTVSWKTVYEDPPKHDPDLLNPPNGGYCFIEWDDMDVNDRRAVLERRMGSSWSRVKDAERAYIRNAIGGMHSVEGLILDVMSLIEAREAKEAKRAAQLARDAENRPADGLAEGKYLLAQPHEIGVIRELVDGGYRGREVIVREYLPAFVCMKPGNAGPARPGDLVGGITMGRAIKTHASDGVSYDLWRVEVFER